MGKTMVHRTRVVILSISRISAIESGSCNVICVYVRPFEELLNVDLMDDGME